MTSTPCLCLCALCVCMCMCAHARVWCVYVCVTCTYCTYYDKVELTELFTLALQRKHTKKSRHALWLAYNLRTMDQAQLYTLSYVMSDLSTKDKAYIMPIIIKGRFGNVAV